jgi:hypothetical protein
MSLDGNILETLVQVWKRTHLLLPDGWYEVPNRSPREYRRAAAGSGVLQVSHLPPRPQVRGTDGEVDEALTDLLAESADALELGEPLACATGPCTYGRYVTALFRHPEQGRVRVWFPGRPGEPLLFATFTKQASPGWDEESADAQAMMESADVREVEPPI